MSTGTVTLTKGSKTVTGSGTSFTTELKSGDFIVATVGGTSYTLGVAAIASNTSLTVSVAYDGPTTAGLAWQAVPLATLNLITSALAAQVSYAIRANNLDRDNWQQIFTGTGNVTVRLPDGTSWTGPAWNSITSSVNQKAAKGNNNDITSLSALTTAITVAQGGTGAGTAAEARNNLGLGSIATQNTDSVNITGGNIKVATLVTDSANISGGTGSFTALEVKSGATEPLILRTLSSGNGYLRFRDASENPLAYLGFASGATQNLALASNLGNNNITLNTSGSVTVKAGTANYAFQTNGTATATLWQNTSDSRIKKDIEKIDNAKDVISAINGYRFSKRYNLTEVTDPLYVKDAGVIAQELESVIPEAVSSNDFGAHDNNNNAITDLLSVNYAAITPYLIEYVKEQQREIDSLKNDIASIKNSLESFNK